MVLVADRLQRQGRLKPISRQGIVFWSSIYIPVVVAMAASQNVLAAVEGGPAALLAGVLAVCVGFALVPAISRVGRSERAEPKETSREDGR